MQRQAAGGNLDVDRPRAFQPIDGIGLLAAVDRCLRKRALHQTRQPGFAVDDTMPGLVLFIKTPFRIECFVGSANNHDRLTTNRQSQIAKATQGNEHFADAFFEAVYNMAYCRLRYGEIANRKDAIESAMTDIKNQLQLFPGMGGPQWKPKFDELLRKIQSSLGQPVTGLQ